MKNYYIARVTVIMEGLPRFEVIITGMGYNPVMVVKNAETITEAQFPSNLIVSVIIDKTDLDIEEYKQITKSNIPWLINTEDYN